MTTAAIDEPRTRRWSYEEYYQMADMGFFHGQRVELIDGEIVEMAPQGNFHAMVVGLCREALAKLFTTGYWIREQLPLRFDTHSAEPEPDLSVVIGHPRAFATSHPATAVLIIEVSETTLDYDRGRKADLYASAGIQDYWIVNLKERQVEQFRSPAVNTKSRYGYAYNKIEIYKVGQSISPLAVPGHLIQVADLLP